VDELLPLQHDKELLMKDKNKKQVEKMYRKKKKWKGGKLTTTIGETNLC
jgi:hypothetical protein